MSLTEHWLLHSASDVVGTAKMFALSYIVSLHLMFYGVAAFSALSPNCGEIKGHCRLTELIVI